MKTNRPIYHVGLLALGLLLNQSLQAKPHRALASGPFTTRPVLSPFYQRLNSQIQSTSKWTKQDQQNTASNGAQGAARTATSSSPTRVLEYAATGVGSPYAWGGSQWDTSNRKILGADCSGFTQKSWGYPQYYKTNESIPGKYRLSSKEFYAAQDSGYPWKRMDHLTSMDAQPADAMVYRRNGRGHIFLVTKKDVSGLVTVEARGKNLGIGYSRRNHKSVQASGYKIIRKR